MIYFAECIGADAIKIGLCQAARVHARVSSMQSGCPMPLKLLAVVDGSREEERELHGQFSDYWIRGEWFRATNELRALIAKFPTAAPPVRQGDPRYGRKPTKIIMRRFPLVPAPGQLRLAAVSCPTHSTALE